MYPTAIVPRYFSSIFKQNSVLQSLIGVKGICAQSAVKGVCVHVSQEEVGMGHPIDLGLPTCISSNH